MAALPSGISGYLITMRKPITLFGRVTGFFSYTHVTETVKNRRQHNGRQQHQYQHAPGRCNGSDFAEHGECGDGRADVFSG